MSETRETIEKLKQELQEVRAAAGTRGTEATPSECAGEVSVGEPKAPPAISSRARGRAARAVAGAASPGQLSFDPAALGIKSADKTELASAVQTTREIIAEYA